MSSTVCASPWRITSPLEAQQRMLQILQFKLDVLWSMLDAMSMAYELERPPYHTVTRDNVWHRGIAL